MKTQLPKNSDYLSVSKILPVFSWVESPLKVDNSKPVKRPVKNKKSPNPLRIRLLELLEQKFKLEQTIKERAYGTVTPARIALKNCLENIGEINLELKNAKKDSKPEDSFETAWDMSLKK